MNKVTVNTVLASFGTLMLGTMMIATNAQAKEKSYNWSASQEDARLYYTNTNKNAYVWNTAHTKKLHNLKNYPYSTWYVTKSFAKTYNGKKRVYYKVANYGAKVKGMVWRGYLTPAKSAPISSFSSDSEYMAYLSTNKSQKLSRALISKMSGVDVSLKLSQEAADNNFTSFKNVIRLDLLRGETGISLNGRYIKFGDKSLFEYAGLTQGGTASARANMMMKVLSSRGYNSAKINSLSNYKLGIIVDDGTTYTTGSAGYPGTLGNMQSNFTLVLAQSK